MPDRLHAASENKAKFCPCRDVQTKRISANCGRERTQMSGEDGMTGMKLTIVTIFTVIFTTEQKKSVSREPVEGGAPRQCGGQRRGREEASLSRYERMDGSYFFTSSSSRCSSSHRRLRWGTIRCCVLHRNRRLRNRRRRWTLWLWSWWDRRSCRLQIRRLRNRYLKGSHIEAVLPRRGRNIGSHSPPLSFHPLEDLHPPDGLQPPPPPPPNFHPPPP